MTEYPSRFLACLPFTLAQECPMPEDWSNVRNFSNDAHDPGGQTMCGITSREYSIYRKMCGEFTQPVVKCSQSEGYQIYFENYWRPHCPFLLAGVDLVFFDASVNEGPVEATRILQYTLGVHNDGVWGPITQRAVNGIGTNMSTPDFINAYTQRRKEVYTFLAGYPYFGKGWERRAAEIGQQALLMVN